MLKVKKRQYGGQMRNLIPDFKPWEFDTFWQSKDTQQMIQMSDKLQTIYDARLTKKDEYDKVFRDLNLDPNLYKDFQNEHFNNYNQKMQQLLMDSDNNLLSDSFAKGMLNITNDFVTDPRLKTAQWNTEKSQEWKKNVAALQEKGLYNQDLDPNFKAYEQHFKRDRNIFEPWNTQAILPYYSYTDSLMAIAAKVEYDTEIFIEPVSDYDAWYTQVQYINEGKIANTLQAFKDDFLVSTPGQVFRKAVADKFGYTIDAHGRANPEEVKNGKSYKKALDDEFILQVSSIAAAKAYNRDLNVGQIGKTGQLQADLKDKEAAITKAKAEAEQKAVEDKTWGLWKSNTPSSSNNIEINIEKRGTPGSYDYESNYNASYNVYKTEYDNNRAKFGDYSVKGSDNNILNFEEMLDRYSNSALDNLSLYDSNGAVINPGDSRYIEFENNIQSTLHSRSKFKESAAELNTRDASLVKSILSTKNTYGGQNTSTLNHKAERVEVADRQFVSIKKITDNTGAELWLVTDDDKNLVDNIMTPYEFTQTYKGAKLDNIITPKIGFDLYQFDKQLTDDMNNKQKAWIESKVRKEGYNPNVASEMMPQLLTEYRVSEEYKADLELTRKQILNKYNTSNPLYSSYLDSKAAHLLKEFENITNQSDTYTTLPHKLMTSTEAVGDYMRTIVASVQSTPQNRKFFDVSLGKEVDWTQLTDDLEAIQSYNAWPISFNSDVYEKPYSLNIEGYDMNNKLGGVWVASVVIDLGEIRKRYSDETDTELVTILNSVNELNRAGHLQHIEGTEKYKIIKSVGNDKSEAKYLIADPIVAEEYYRNTLSNDANIIKKSTDTYNAMRDAFNSGQEVTSFLAGDNKLVTFQRDDLQGVNMMYKDMYDNEQFVHYDNMEEAAKSFIEYNYMMVSNSQAINQNKFIASGANVSGINMKGKNVLQSVMDNSIPAYVTSYKNDDTYKRNADPNKDKLYVTGKENEININYSSTNYASRSILNLLRQIASLKEIKENGLRVYDPSYTNLSQEQRNDLSTLQTYPELDMNNSAQRRMIKQLFGREDLQIIYPDNGSSGQIIIKILN
jgi:hypothetical protein